jgi:hypothetical protein
MQCPNGCVSELRERRVEKIFHRNEEPVVLSNLLVYVCPECGHESLPLSSARLIEAVLNGDLKPSGTFTAELYEAGSAI